MSKRHRHLLIWLAFLGFACRALVPVGFMPAAAGDGGLFMICHGGPVGALFESLRDGGSPASVESGHGHGHVHEGHTGAGFGHGMPTHDGAGPSSQGAWDTCDVGAAFAHIAVAASSFDITLLHFSDALARLEPDRPVYTIAVGPYRARAPPAS